MLITRDEDDLPDLVDTAGAAHLLAHVGVSEALVRRWKARGLLRPALIAGGRPVYRMADVWAVERDTRTSAGSRRSLTFTR